MLCLRVRVLSFCRAVDRDADDFIGKFSVSIAKVVKKIKVLEKAVNGSCYDLNCHTRSFLFFLVCFDV